MGRLSPRQQEIVRLVALGKTTKEISAELGIAESTVNWHVTNVLGKLEASSRAEAVALALTEGHLESERPVEPIALETHSRRGAVAARIAVAVLAFVVIASGGLLALAAATGGGRDLVRIWPLAPPASVAPSREAEASPHTSTPPDAGSVVPTASTPPALPTIPIPATQSPSALPLPTASASVIVPLPSVSLPAPSLPLPTPTLPSLP